MYNFYNPFDDKDSGRDKRRSFSPAQKNDIFYQQGGKCAICHKPLDIRIAQFDHKKPWADKGRTISRNGRALHPDCHALKTHKERVKKADGKPASKKRKTASDPLDYFALPEIKQPKMPSFKMPKGGFGLF